MIVAELSENKNLIKVGNIESSSGSDSAPSEDNLNPLELHKNLPIIERSQKTKSKQTEIVKSA